MRFVSFFRSVCRALGVAAAVTLAGCSPGREVSVLQFNIWQEGTMVPGGFEAIADEVARLEPDFVTLSEPRNYHGTRFCDRIVEALRSRGKTYYSFYSYDSGLLSRHPIADSATVFPIQGDHGTVYKLSTTLHGKPMAVYTAHLDYQNDTYYEVRGYDGNSWRRMEEPLLDVPTILKRNDASLRDEEICAFLADAAREVEQGSYVFLGGDFNEPSHLDWTEATKDSADHHGIVVPWTCTRLLEEGGFRDAYRERYPNPVTHPGYTYPSDNPALAPLKITWAPQSDERDRIDYVFFYPRRGLRVKDAFIVGPRGCIRYGKRAVESSRDTFVEPLGVWPSDHKGVLVRFRLK